MERVPNKCLIQYTLNVVLLNLLNELRIAGTLKVYGEPRYT